MGVPLFTFSNIREVMYSSDFSLPLFPNFDAIWPKGQQDECGIVWHLLVQVWKYLDLEPLVLTLRFEYLHNIGWNANVCIKYWCNLVVGPFHFKSDIYHVFKFFYHFYLYSRLLSFKKEEQSILNYIIF
jgi:hypothetical protein